MEENPPQVRDEGPPPGNGEEVVNPPQVRDEGPPPGNGERA